jgi:gluconolactonase
MTGPQGVYDVQHPHFRDLTIPTVVPVKIADGMVWAEGPVWFSEHDCLIWSDIPSDRMWRYFPGLGTAVFRAPSNFANGNTRDWNGSLLTCEQGGRRVTRTRPDGTIEVVADRFEGHRLNSPNDVVVAPDQGIWFTDPPYGILSDHEGHRGDPEYGGCHVFRVDPMSKRVEAMATDFVKPNGLAFSPDARRLYVADSGRTHDPAGPHHVRVFSVDGFKRLSGGEIFAEIAPGVPDGLRVDIEGNVWISAGDGIHTYAPDGTLLGKVHLPATVSNLCFGGSRHNRLFVTATDAVWAIAVNIKGAMR